MSLRSKLIRLAHDNPSFRKDLLPLIQASESKVAASKGTLAVSMHRDRMYITARRLFGSATVDEVNEMAQDFVSDVARYLMGLDETLVTAGFVGAEGRSNVKPGRDARVAGFASGAFIEVSADLFYGSLFTDEDGVWKVITTTARKHGFTIKK